MRRTRRHRQPSLHVVAVAALAVILLAACGSAEIAGSVPPSAGATPTASVLPSPTALAATGSAQPEERPCEGADLRASGGPWGGAAGSRGADVVVANEGTSPCRLSAGPMVALVDTTGRVLLASRPGRTGVGPVIRPGDRAGFSVVFSNWCDETASLPLAFRLDLASGSLEIGGLPLASTDALPPCNGPGQPASLSTTDWEAG